MKALLYKEARLASPLTYFFLLFSLTVLIPNYPSLLGAFFICYGVFHTFQKGRENGEPLFTALMPIRKSDVVRSRFLFAWMIRFTGLFLILLFSLLRECFLSETPVYASEQLLQPGFVLFSWMLLINSMFDLVFMARFYRTGRKLGVPFLLFSAVSVVIVLVSEILPHIPGMEWMNDGFSSGKPLGMFLICCVICGFVSFCSLRLSCRRFEKAEL